MIDREPIEVPEPYRLAGEEVPTWLAAGFALVGSLLAVAAVWLWLTERLPSPERAFQARPTQEQATAPTAQPDIAHPAKPNPLPAATPAMATTSERRPDIAPESRPPLAAPADVTAGPDDSRDTAMTEQTSPAATGRTSEREDCPPAMLIAFKRGGVQPVITDADRRSLERLREWLNRHPGEKLTVEGHADTKGSERYNLLLSYRRAKKVVGILDQAGVPERQIAILAAGETSPIEGIPADSEDNRRVILQVKGIENCRGAPVKSEGS